MAECPTVAAFSSATSAARRPPEAPSVLLVDGSRGGAMPVLAEATDEVQALRRLYRSPRLWSTEVAPMSDLNEWLKASGLIHFAAHGVVDRSNQLLSGIVLGEGKAIVYAHEIAAMGLRNNPIVVLAGCSGAASDELDPP